MDSSLTILRLNELKFRYKYGTLYSDKLYSSLYAEEEHLWMVL